jgi:hypothetical protein
VDEDALVGADDLLDEFVGSVQVRHQVRRRDIVDLYKYMLSPTTTFHTPQQQHSTQQH